MKKTILLILLLIPAVAFAQPKKELDADDDGAIDLGIGGTGSVFVDPNVDRLWFWDDSATDMEWLTLGSEFLITDTTLNLADDSIVETRLNTTNEPTDDYVPSYDLASGGFTWVAGSGGLGSVAEDATPQLGSDLDLNSSDITGTGNVNITGTVTSSSGFRSSGSAPEMQLNDSDAAGIDDADEYAGGVGANMTDTTEDAEVSDVTTYYQSAGVKTEATAIDGSANQYRIKIDMVVEDGKSIILDESAADPDDADVVISGADGVLTIKSQNGAYNETLTIDTDGTDNTIVIGSAAATRMSIGSLNFDTTGTIKGRFEETPKTSSTTLTLAEIASTAVTNYGETDDADLILTAPDMDSYPGYGFIYQVTTAMATNDTCIKAAADNLINYEGTDGADNGCVCNASPAKGDRLTCMTVTTGAGVVDLFCSSVIGTWAAVADNTGDCPD